MMAGIRALMWLDVTWADVWDYQSAAKLGETMAEKLLAQKSAGMMALMLLAVRWADVWDYQSAVRLGEMMAEKLLARMSAGMMALAVTWAVLTAEK